jgi:hypothetical protein
MDKKNAPPIRGAGQVIEWCIAEQRKLQRQLKALEAGDSDSGATAEEIKKRLTNLQVVLDAARKQLN